MIWWMLGAWVLSVVTVLVFLRGATQKGNEYDRSQK